MKRYLNLSTKLIALLIGLVTPIPAIAESIDYNGTSSNSMTSAGWFALIFTIIIIIIIFAAVTFFFVFWIIMLIDAFQRTNWQDDNQKNLWLIALIVSFFLSMNWLAALLYYFIIRKPLGKASHQPAKVVSSPSEKK